MQLWGKGGNTLCALVYKRTGCACGVFGTYVLLCCYCIGRTTFVEQCEGGTCSKGTQELYSQVLISEKRFDNRSSEEDVGCYVFK